MRLYPSWLAIICCMTLAFVLGVATGAGLLYVLAFALLALLVALFFIEVLR